MMSPGAALTGQSRTGLGWRFRDAERPVGFAPILVRRLRHGEVQGLAQEPRIRSRAALIPEVQEKRPVRVGELRSAQTINVIFCRDPMKLQPLKLATKA